VGDHGFFVLAARIFWLGTTRFSPALPTPLNLGFGGTQSMMCTRYAGTAVTGQSVSLRLSKWGSLASRQAAEHALVPTRVI